ncbi:hypothetical protein POSPLADRAFT_1053822 [Postia placenta MAD-698-R-SB12]|uniref:TRP C-terminal domain-containing protein n=1 Tax=Postia placenta MAD-698-R-SB12 TaxID=670580 RepID=A0A1X6N9I2_9APHY|nr:hypothetical protein POSPLADRAFT_1053822 [Postia placenta MAD-698-R-SB12]OSX65033.1 hypothetical protein POSPLADRAFT_1053822 [Postia placenta MAD-698-R-SB12]
MAPEPLLSTRAQRAFIGTIGLQAIIVLVMVSITFKFVEEHVDLTIPRYKTLPCYLALFILAEIFEMFMALDALRLRNVIQLIGILSFHAAMIVMAALQIHETHTALYEQPNSTSYYNPYVNGDGPGTLWRKIEPFLVVTPIIIALSWVCLVFLFRELYHEFGWAIFHVVGANPVMKTMYQYYQIMICLLKFDFFAFIGVTMQLLIVVLIESTAEFGLTIAAIPVTLVLLIMAGAAVQREIKSIMSISLVLMLASQVYLTGGLFAQLVVMSSSVYKLVRFYAPSSEDQYITTRATLTVFTIVASLLLFATFGVGVRCFADFDKGLQSSKMHGQYYKPVATQLRENLFGN